MSSATETRLAAYYAAEAAILQAQEARRGDRSRRMADLAAVQAQIKVLEQQLAREKAAEAGRGGLNYSLADLSGDSLA